MEGLDPLASGTANYAFFRSAGLKALALKLTIKNSKDGRLAAF
jgi:hypothetical protein